MKKNIINILLILFVFVLLVFAISAIAYGPEFVFRNIRYGESDTNDYLIFDSVAINKSTNPHIYPVQLNDRIKDLKIGYSTGGKTTVNKLADILENNDTTSFIVVKDGKIVFEEYYKGYKKESIFTSFSAVKSIDSLMIGIAIDEGYINSINQTASDFIPELEEKPVGDVTIKELLSMRSNIAYFEGLLYFSDDSKTYYDPDLRSLAINSTRIDKNYDGRFHYNNYHPLLLGIILERSTGMSVSQFFENMVWEKIGAEYNASWSVDSPETKFEKMESGLNFRSIDFAKIGSALLNQGNLNGNTIVSTDWISESTLANFPLGETEYEASFLEDSNTGYKYMWYSFDNGDYFAAGKYGQFLYISPTNNVVIVRTGTSAGKVDWWADILKEVAASIN